MRRMIRKLGGMFVPIIFCTALIFTASMSLDLTDDLQGNARVINYIGIVRGATQRLIKKELNHEPDDELIYFLDNILSGLSNGSDELNLIKLDSEEFQTMLIEMQNDWEDIKTQIYNYRKGSSRQLLYELSEDYFELANHNFRVFLQPKINVEDCRMVGAEALIRYQDENGSIIAPDKFIPVLEDTYLISKIDYYVFEEVCKTLSIWNGQGKTVFTISSNFSKITFMEECFIKRLEEISDKYQVQRKYLEIEITESVNYTDLDTLVTRINQIRDAGFRVAMDDFGVESSNLALLSLVKFDILKIDKGFVKDIISNKRAQIIIGMMTKMCSEMGIQLIAEGIEDGQQFNVLREYGVKTVQGYLFSKPVSIPEYEEKYMN